MWIKDRRDININELELLAVIVAIKKWGTMMENANLLAYGDNQVTVDIVNKGKAKNLISKEKLSNQAGPRTWENE